MATTTAVLRPALAPVDRPAAPVDPHVLTSPTTHLTAMGWVGVAFWREVSVRALRELVELCRPPQPDDGFDPATLGSVRWRAEADRATTVVGEADDERGGTVLWLVRRGAADAPWSVTIAAADRDAADRARRRVLDLLPDVPVPEGDTVDLRYWSLGSHGPEWFRRDIAAPAWAAVRSDYAASVADRLDHLVATERPVDDCRLVLLHGPPGTGKTSFIRALARAWRPWCEPSYIVDPDRLFANPSYLLEVVTGGQSGDDGDGNGGGEWKLLVVEDADELLLADAKERSGQALNRLLNLTDGLIGDGLRVIVLITTNVDHVRLHPALRRAGRCLANVAVGPLPPDEVAAWLAAHDVDPSVGADGRPRSLAELAALAAGRVPDDDEVVALPGYL